MARISDIVGYKKEVEKLNSICDFLNNTEKYTDYGIDLPNCLLIYGLSGVGKTFMAEALATDSGREIFNVPIRRVGVREIKKIFKTARKSAPSIVVVDDLDYDSDMYWCIDNELANCEISEVFVVITAYDRKNLPDYLLSKIDSDMIMELSTPKIEEACEIFKPIFDEKKIGEDFNINDFCCFAQDSTFAYAKETFNKAARLAIYEGQDYISMCHLIKAGLLINDNVLATEFDATTAYHEAGHAAVNLLLSGDAACIVLLDNSGGYFNEKDWHTKTYKDKERRYIVSVAGKACEEIFTGTSSIGSYSDLGKVSEEIEADVKILASQGFEYFDSTELNSPEYNDALAKKVQSDLQRYYDRAKELIEQNRPLVDTLVEKLRDKFYLLHSEINRIYNYYISAKK